MTVVEEPIPGFTKTLLLYVCHPKMTEQRYFFLFASQNYYDTPFQVRWTKVMLLTYNCSDKIFPAKKYHRPQQVLCAIRSIYGT